MLNVKKFKYLTLKKFMDQQNNDSEDINTRFDEAESKLLSALKKESIINPLSVFEQHPKPVILKVKDPLTLKGQELLSELKKQNSLYFQVLSFVLQNWIALLALIVSICK